MMPAEWAMNPALLAKAELCCLQHRAIVASRPSLPSTNLDIIEIRNALWSHRTKTDFPQMFGRTLTSMSL